jgi:phosphoglycerate kinase
MKRFADYNFSEKKALVRVDFNVPLDSEHKITDDTRIKAAIPTIKKILADGGSVILMSHLGRPKGKVNEDMSLKHIKGRLQELLNGTNVTIATDCVGPDAEAKAHNLKAGEVLLLENLRFHSEEEEGQEDFSKKLSKLGDVYVNDAFGTAHRAHASTTIAAKYFNDKLFGLVMEGEINSIDKILKEGKKPFTAIIGGSKVSDKVGIIANLLEKADNILIGGAMAYTFKKALGGEVGNSRIEADKLELAKELVEKAKIKGVRLYLPEDSLNADSFSNEANKKVSVSDNIPQNWMGLDIGPEACKTYKNVILESNTILWNGPMGVFEWENFENGTKEVALAVAEATKKGAFSLIGGGDSVAAIHKFKLDDKVSYISTGGGAMLEYLEGIQLPGIAAILNS